MEIFGGITFEIVGEYYGAREPLSPVRLLSATCNLLLLCPAVIPGTSPYCTAQKRLSLLLSAQINHERCQNSGGGEGAAGGASRAVSEFVCACLRTENTRGDGLHCCEPESIAIKAYEKKRQKCSDDDVGDDDGGAAAAAVYVAKCMWLFHHRESKTVVVK